MTEGRKDRNLLLGNGQKIAVAAEISRGGGKKRKPYSLQQVREALAQPLNDLAIEIAALPREAKPRGEAVFELTLHPAFLAKTYFPSDVLRAAGLRDVGSKTTNIVPRNTVQEKDRGRSFATATLFVAGDEKAVSRLAQIVASDSAPQAVQDDVLEIETVRLPSAAEKLRGVVTNDAPQVFEVALHAGSDAATILDSFLSWAKQLNAEVQVERKIQVGGLTFLPVRATRQAIERLAQFAFLRIARPMPELRMALPAGLRHTITTEPVQLPTVAPSDARRVAIFDGGLGTADMAKWATETTFPGTQDTHGNLLSHGNEVTSTFLFGRIDDPNKPLPAPYMGVDHFRVLSLNSGRDPDLFDVLHRVKQVLESGRYKFANLSLGPRMPVADEDVHAWTATLDQLASKHGIFITVAVGNDGEEIDGGANRIQPPSDMVNALAVGAADSCGPKWKRAPYSCIGPGRSPGYVKPDGVAFGGTAKELFKVFNPFMNQVVGVCGTSYSSPLVLRTSAGVAASTNYPMDSISLKALMIHHAEIRRHKREEVGWGRFPEDPMQLLECAPDSVTVIFQGSLEKGQFLRCPIPVPNLSLVGETSIRATLCLQSPTDPEHAVNYTRAGMRIVFRPRAAVNEKETTEFFGKATQYKQTEGELRADAHKWETTLHRERKFSRPELLAGPLFDIEYQARESSRGVSPKDAPDMQYALVVTLTVKGMSELYNLIRQKYTVLQPVDLRAEIQVSGQA